MGKVACLEAGFHHNGTTIRREARPIDRPRRVVVPLWLLKTSGNATPFVETQGRATRCHHAPRYDARSCRAEAGLLHCPAEGRSTTVAIVLFVLIAVVGIYGYSAELRDALSMYWRRPPRK